MNFVKPVKKSEPIYTTLGNVLVKVSGKTAFLGICGYGNYGLYLISYDTIIKADNPRETWSSPGCIVRIDRYVDIEITVKE